MPNKSKNTGPRHKRAQQNARDRGAGPFVVLAADNAALINDASGCLFAVVHVADCIGGKDGAKARASRIAEALNGKNYQTASMEQVAEGGGELAELERLVAEAEATGRGRDALALRWGLKRLQQHLAEAGPVAASEEQLVDQWWDRLAEANHRKLPDGAHVIQQGAFFLISRDELCEAMIDAALLATEPLVSTDVGGIGRPVASLVQSLKVMGDKRAEEGADGHAVIARRAREFVVTLTRHVTRFLEYPGQFARHVLIDADLQIERVDVLDDGRVLCTVHPVGQPEVTHQFQLSELNAAGAVDDAVRVMVRSMCTAVVEDMVVQLVAKGALRELPPVERPDDAEDCSACGATGRCGCCGGVGWIEPLRDVTISGVHHLQPHAEYIMGPDSAHAEPVVPRADLPLDGQ